MNMIQGIEFYVLLLLFGTSFCQRIAPGVPPQQYHQQQHVPQHGQMHQQHVPQNQMHVQQQQQQQQPPPHHHVPVYQQEAHPSGQGQILNAAYQHEKGHIAEHLEVPIDTSKMSEQELQFHYFKMHDADNNNKLDGCELIKSVIHWHEEGGKERSPQGQVREKIFVDEELTGLIDPILNTDDGNRDGYIDYPEFVRAQQKATAAAPKPT